jgi:uncharacterized protein (DUF1330 family)
MSSVGGGHARRTYAAAVAAYIVAHTTIRDLEGYLASEYPAVLQRLFEKYGGTPIGVGLHEHLEGSELGPLTVIDQFPDVETARAFRNDPEYQRIIPIRKQFSDAQVVLLDGLAPG